ADQKWRWPDGPHGGGLGMRLTDGSRATALPWRGRRDWIGRRWGVPVDREGRREQGATCGAIGRREVTAVGPQDAARNGQTQPRASGLPIARGFAPVERREQVGHIMSGLSAPFGWTASLSRLAS